MTTTVAALYDRLDDAHRAAQELAAAGLPDDAVSLVTGDQAAQAAGLPDADVRLYVEGVRRGGALLLVRAEESVAERVRGIVSRTARTGGSTTRRAAELAARIESEPLQGEERGAAPAPDSTDFGQPASSPGTRGGATAFGGIERVPERKPERQP